MSTQKNAANAATAANAAQESTNAQSTTATAEKLVVTINAVRVFDNDGKINVHIEFDEIIKGYKAEGVGFDECDVNYIDIHRSKLTKQLCEHSDLIADYRATRTEAFGQKEFAIILRGAKMTIVRTPHVAGELTGRQNDQGQDIVYTYNGYTTDVVGVRLTESATAKLNRATEL